MAWCTEESPCADGGQVILWSEGVVGLLPDHLSSVEIAASSVLNEEAMADHHGLPLDPLAGAPLAEEVRAKLASLADELARVGEAVYAVAVALAWGLPSPPAFDVEK